MKKMSAGARAVQVVVLLLLFTYAVTIVYPMIWMTMSGFKDNKEFFLSSWNLPEVWHPENYIEAWNIGVNMYFLNSVIVTVISVALTVLSSGLLGFALSRYEFRLKRLVFIVVLGGMMLSPEVSLIALFRLLQTIGIDNSHAALIVPYTAFRISFTTFLVRSYFLDLPKDMEEAAYIDGCSTFQIFTKIILPVSKPIIATASLLAAMVFWNEFMFGLVFIESEALKTIPVGLMNLRGTLTTRWTTLFAGLTISAIPIIALFLICQKQFVRGLTSGSVKG
jgi:raffinose/stachyose/melibiose transport system permease protein